MLQELEQSKCNVSCQSDEIQSLLKKNDDLMREQNETSMENKRLLEEADTSKCLCYKNNFTNLKEYCKVSSP